MKTGIDFLGDERCPKFTQLKLIKIFQEEQAKDVLGEGVVDISQYYDQSEKSTEVLEMKNGVGKIEFQIKSLSFKETKRH